MRLFKGRTHSTLIFNFFHIFRTGSSPIVDGCKYKFRLGFDPFILSRNQNLIALYPGSVWLVDHPSEGPAVGPSTLPKLGRTSPCPVAGPYACTAGSKPTLFPFPLPQDTPAEQIRTNKSEQIRNKSGQTKMTLMQARTNKSDETFTYLLRLLLQK